MASNALSRPYEKRSRENYVRNNAKMKINEVKNWLRATATVKDSGKTEAVNVPAFLRDNAQSGDVFPASFALTGTPY